MTMKRAKIESERAKRLENSPQSRTQAFWAALIAFALLGAAVFGAGWFGALKTVDAPVPAEITTDTIRAIIRQEIKPVKEQLDSTDPLPNIQGRQKTMLRHVSAIKWDRSDRGGNWIARIDNRLKGTRMAGQGRAFVLAAADHGLPPNLSVAIALHESGAGRYTPPGSFNAFGMTGPTSSDFWDVPGKGPDGTRMYQAYPDWETGIRYHAAFIARTWPGADGPEDLRGYAVSTAWLGAVREQVARI